MIQDKLSTYESLWRAPLKDLDASFSSSGLEFTDLRATKLDWYGEGQWGNVLHFTCGYESRSVYFAEKFSGQFDQVVFTSLRGRRELRFESNQQWCEKMKFSEIRVAEGRANWQSAFSFGAELIEISDAKGLRELRVTVDVSCASRERVCSLVSAFLRVSKVVPLKVHFVYVPMEYDEPLLDLPPIEKFGPVSPDFLCLGGAADSPVSLVVGLGYEQDRALGAVEYLAPGEVWCFRPTGTDLRFDTALAKANAILLERLGADRVFKYSLRDPGGLMLALSSLVRPDGSGRRTVLVPFGPKLFTLACALTAARYSGEISVFRVSADRREPAVDRNSSETALGLFCDFRPKAS